MQARFFDPVAGRFLATDPIGYQDQFNFYAYVHNDPVNMVDPTGEGSTCSCSKRPGIYPKDGVLVSPDGKVTRLPHSSSDLSNFSTIPPPTGLPRFEDTLIGKLINLVTNNDNQGETAPLPDKPVGEKPRTGNKGRINSGPLTPENGGTGDAEQDFGVLTGGQSQPAPEGSTLPAGSQVGDNGVIIRPGSREGDGPRIDIPENGDKPRETLHYPK